MLIPFAAEIRRSEGRKDPVVDSTPGMALGVARDALPAWAVPNRLVSFRVEDDAMARTVRQGDLVALDPGWKTPVDSGLFVLVTEDGPVVRRLHDREGWIVTGDNPEHAGTPLSGANPIFGRVAWCGPRERGASSDPERTAT